MTSKQMIKELKKKKNKGRTVSSIKASMYKQSRSSILYWLFEDGNMDVSIRNLISIISTDDWSFDEKST